MKVVIVQGMSGLGKSTLCQHLEESLPDCKWFSLDHYKERLWDEKGFSSVEEREALSRQAKGIFVKEIDEAIKSRKYKYILIDSVIKKSLWQSLSDVLYTGDKIVVEMLFLEPYNTYELQRVWVERSRDFTRRHPGHGAEVYDLKTRTGSGYDNNYQDKINIMNELVEVDDILKIKVYFNPYHLSVLFRDILAYIG